MLRPLSSDRIHKQSAAREDTTSDVIARVSQVAGACLGQPQSATHAIQTAHPLSEKICTLFNLADQMIRGSDFSHMHFFPDDPRVSREFRLNLALSLAYGAPIPCEGGITEYVSVGSGALLQDFYNIALWLGLADAKHYKIEGQTLHLHFIDAKYTTEGNGLLEDERTKWQEALQEFQGAVAKLAAEYHVTINTHTYTSIAAYEEHNHEKPISMLSAIRVPMSVYHPNYALQGDFKALLDHLSTQGVSLCISDRNQVINFRTTALLKRLEDYTPLLHQEFRRIDVTKQEP